MDRNTDPINLSDIPPKSLSARRAWIEILCLRLKIWLFLSLSARRAWIEISRHLDGFHFGLVALRKESVDRNTSIDNLTQGVFKSLSARRAWIEIWCIFYLYEGGVTVALRKESVDRN